MRERVSKKNTGDLGDSQERPEIIKARELALSAVVDGMAEMIALMKDSEPPRGAQFKILAFREVMAMAQGLKAASVEGATHNVRVLLIDKSALTDELAARKLKAVG